MLSRAMRSTLLGAVLAAMVPGSPLLAQQGYTFSSCATLGVCGTVQAFFTGSLLTVRLQNADNSLGSAMFDAQLLFSSALNPASPGASFTFGATALATGGTTSIGTTPTGAWSFSGVGGSNVLDLAAFMNAYVEGSAASPYRALPGDPDNGTWVTGGSKSFVEFTADLSGVTGFDGANLVQMSFCTDQNCVTGDAVATPEPATLALCATGFLGILAVRRRRKNAIS